jgi:hypothetical protein
MLYENETLSQVRERVISSLFSSAQSFITAKQTMLHDDGIGEPPLGKGTARKRAPIANSREVHLSQIRERCIAGLFVSEKSFAVAKAPCCKVTASASG